MRGSTVDGVHVAALSAWLGQAGMPGEVTDLARLPGGTQNRLLRFRHADRSLVLRLPPVAKRANSDETLRREARVLGAIRGTGVPHPALVAAEPSLEPLGAAFLVTEWVDGVASAGELRGPYAHDPEWRRAIGPSIATAIARLGSLDPVALGLGDLARPGSFLERQAGRWSAQLESYAGTPGYEPLDAVLVRPVVEWLEAHRPPDQAPGLVHGDLHAANVLLDAREPGVAAIVDWELATVGDPLLDLAQLLVTWPDARGDSALTGIAGITPPDGLVGREELVASYAAGSERDLSKLPWYEALAAFRLAAIIEGTWARAQAGLADPRTGLVLHTAALHLLERAHQAIATA